MPIILPPTHLLNLSIVLVVFGYALVGQLKWHSRPTSNARVGPTVFAALIICLLFVGRWPMIVQRYELNPDESQIIAGALTLGTDLVPWRSVDAMTTGPLSDYWLVVANVFAPLDFMVARVWAVLTLGAALVLTYATLRRLTSDTVARCATTPALLFATFTTHHDFTHYSSEHLPVLLIAAAVYCLVRMMTGEQYRTSMCWGIMAALLLGAQPWTKLQVVPIAFPVGLVGVGWWVRSNFPFRHRIAGIIAMTVASLATSLAFLAILVGHGLWNDFYDRYLSYVFEYASSRPHSAWELLMNFGRYADPTSGMTWLSAGAVAWLVSASVILWRQRGPLVPRQGLWLSLIYATTAFGTCLISGRYYTHYLLLMVLPTVFFCGWLLHQVATRIPAESNLPAIRRIPYAVFFVMLVLPPLVHRPYIPQPSMPVELPHADDPVSYKINQVANRGDRLTTWGWMAEYHVRTQLPQGARDAISVNEMEDNPRRDKATRDYIADLELNRTRFFVDAVAPRAFAYATPEWRHDRFPIVRDYIATHYRLFDDHDGVRIYLRTEPERRLPSVGTVMKPAETHALLISH